MTPRALCERHLPATYGALLALSFVGYPVVAAASLALGDYARGVSIAFRALLLGLSLLVLAMSSVLRLRWPRIAILAIGVFWLLLFIRFMWDLSVVSLPLDLPWDEYLLTALGVTFIPAAALARPPAEESLDRAAAWLRILGIIAALCVAAAIPAVLEDIQKQGRLGFDSLNPISMGHLGVSMVIVALFAASRGRFSTLTKVLATMLGFVLTVASASRGPALALVIVLFVGALAATYRRGGFAKAAILGFLVSGALVSGGIALLQSDFADAIPLLSRIGDASSGDQSTSDRGLLVAGALQEFEESPLIGASFVERTLRYYPHNIVVEAAMTTGFVGLALLALILGMTLLGTAALLASRHAWLGLLFLQYFVASMVSGSLYFDSQFWAITIVVVGVRFALRPAPRPSQATYWKEAEAAG